MLSTWRVQSEKLKELSSGELRHIYKNYLLTDQNHSRKLGLFPEQQPKLKKLVLERRKKGRANYFGSM